MKIITREEPPTPEWAGAYKCAHCSSVIEVEGTDYPSIQFVTDMMNRTLDVLWMQCPVCKHPSNMKRQAVK